MLRVARDGTFSLASEYDGWPNGLKIHKDGRIFIADHKIGIMVLDPVSGRVEPYLTQVRREGLKGVNDLVFASNGDLYFTDQGQTDRKSVVSGKSVSVRVDLGGRRIIKKKKTP